VATRGQLRIVPEGNARQSLAADYTAMLDSGILLRDALPFDELMQSCQEVKARINQAAT
jgi:hypothetical protein